jgi:hypothetical protein
MNARTIASLGCKFLGIYALIQAIPLFGQIFQMYAFAKDEPAFGIAIVLSTSIPFLLMVTTAIVLFLYSNRIAEKIIAAQKDGPTNNNISSRELQSIAFSIVGLVLLLMAFPKVVQIGWNIYSIKSIGDERTVAEILRKTWSFALSTGVQFVIGAILFIGSELISSLWHKAIKRLRYERKIT